MTIKDKLFSARWILAVCCGLVFVYGAYTEYLPSATVAVIIVSVFKDYFGRPDREKQEEREANDEHK